MTRVVLVTGASGAVGTRAVAALAGAGWTVRALVHRSAAKGAHEEVAGDVLDTRSLDAAVAAVDAVVHLAGVTHARSQRRYAENVRGTENLLAAAEAAGAGRFVYASTRAIDEGGGAYSRSKRAAERLVERSPLDTTIVRLPEVYGAGGHEGLDRIAASIRRGKPVPVVGRGLDVVCPIHVDDAVDALVTALSAPAAVGKTYTLAGSCMTVADFVERCAARERTTARVVHVPLAVVWALSKLARILPLPLYPDQLARLRAPKPVESDEARADLGFRPRAVFD